MLAAARGQVKSLRWRLTVGAIFATGAALVLESAAAGFGWYLVLALSMCFDYMLGNSYLEQRGQADRKTAGVLFVWGSLFSIAIYAAMPVALAALGGGPGRVLGVLIAASSLVSVMMFTFQAPRFMYLAAIPPTVALLAMPFIPFDPAALNAAQGAGIQAAQTIVKAGAEALVTGHCGPKAFRVLAAAGIKVYNTDASTISEALTRYRAGQLTEATAANVESHWA